MVVIICTLLAVIVKWSNAEMNLKEFNVKGVHRSLLQSMTTNDIPNAQSIGCNDFKTGTYGTSPVFYVFDNTQRQTVTFANCQTTFDPNLYVFDSSLAWISEEACDGDDCGNCGDGGTNAREEFSLDLNTGTYYIELHPCCDPLDDSHSGETYEITTACASPTPEPTQPPTIIYGDLTTCDSNLEISVPESTETLYLWYTLSSTENSIIGIDACDYNQGNNNFYFRMSLIITTEQYSYEDVYAGNTQARCTYNGEGAYLEYESYGDWWLRVTIYGNYNPDAKLKLTRKCEIKITTAEPTPMPTIPVPTPMPTILASVSTEGIIGCNDRVTGVMGTTPHFYELTLQDPMNVHFQDCETLFDSNLYVINTETTEQMNDCYDDCGSCTRWSSYGNKEEYTLNLAAGSYYVKMRPCCGEGDGEGLEYVIVTTCEEATGSPTTHEPTNEPTTPYPTTYAPSRSPLFFGETHPPTTAAPTRNPVTKRPTRNPVTKQPTTSPTTNPVTTDEPKGAAGGVSCYSVMVNVVVVVIGALFG